MLQGLKERLLKEIEAKAPRSIKPDDNGNIVNVIASPDRRFGVWRGGSSLASLITFQNILVTKEEYDEWGA